MADVSKIKVPNGTVYNLKDETARAGLASKAEASHTHTEYALKSKYGNNAINVGRKADTTVGVYSTAEGYNTTASGNSSHAEGLGATANGDYSHAEGSNTTASGMTSHAEGSWTKASGDCSHAEGSNTTASGKCSHAGGSNTEALHDYEVAYGIFNESNDDTLFSIGDGDGALRHNAFEITTTGGKLHDKNIATLNDIPTSLPANGGNAATVGGKSAGEFMPYIGYVADLGAVNQNCICSWSSNTLNTPFKAGKTNAAAGMCIVNNISGLWPTYFVICTGAKQCFIHYQSEGFYGDWKEISTTPIKKMTFTGVAIYEGGGGILFSIDHGTPIAIACTSRRATQCTQFVADDTWYVLAKDAATLDPVPQGSYSFDVWYI